MYDLVKSGISFKTTSGADNYFSLDFYSLPDYLEEENLAKTFVFKIQMKAERRKLVGRVVEIGERGNSQGSEALKS